MDERNEDYDIYGSFACVYDKFMDNVPYKEWGKYLKSLLEEQGISDGLMLELGCGTVHMLAYLRKQLRLEYLLRLT